MVFGGDVGASGGVALLTKQVRDLDELSAGEFPVKQHLQNAVWPNCGHLVVLGALPEYKVLSQSR